ncbi:hypothetical protein A9239_02350 [Methanosarcina sp. A14]|nr:hypothetical protein A9239_02350 [Methanosarcina sp. A14]
MKRIAEKRIRRKPEALHAVYYVPQYSSADDMLPKYTDSEKNHQWPPGNSLLVHTQLTSQLQGI